MKQSSLVSAFNAFSEQAHSYIHITNEEEYAAALIELESILESASDTLSDPLNPLIDLISNAIEVYESQAKELAAFIKEADNTPIDIALLRTIMKNHSLTGSDFPEIGDKTMVSKILNKKRVLQRLPIEKIAERFGFRPGLFLDGK